jgi:hypothetical protein
MLTRSTASIPISHAFYLERKRHAKVIHVGASMSGADFPANCVATTPQGALQSNQRAPVVLRGRASELSFADPSGRAVEGRWPQIIKRNQPASLSCRAQGRSDRSRLTPFDHSLRLNHLVKPPSGRSSQVHGERHGQRLVPRASWGLGFPHATIRSSHHAAGAKTARRT